MTEYIKLLLVAGVIIEKDGKYLLVQEAGTADNPKIRGLWNNPSGRVELGDKIANTAIRETKEETGLTVELLDNIGLFWLEGDWACKYFFTAKAVGGRDKFSQRRNFGCKMV